MKTYLSDQFTHAVPQSAGGRIIKFPLVRLLVAVLFLVPVFVLDKAVKLKIISPLSGDTQVISKYIEAVVFFVLFLIAYRLYTKYVENRNAVELSAPGWLKEFGSGFLISTGLVVLVVLIFYLGGFLNFAGFNPNKRIALDWAVKFAMGAFIEELIFRLIVFRLTEELLGTWTAFLIQAVFFGFAHQANDNATMVTSISLIIVGGVFYTAAFMYSRRIWLPMGIHTGWNYLQSGIFSMPNLGTPYDGLITTAVKGPEAVTGGSFGIEASFIAILLCLIVGIALVAVSYRAGHFTVPLWKRKIAPIAEPI